MIKNLFIRRLVQEQIITITTVSGGVNTSDVGAKFLDGIPLVHSLKKAVRLYREPPVVSRWTSVRMNPMHKKIQIQARWRLEL